MVLIPCGDRPPPTVFITGVTHTYFPLEPGMRWVYEGTHEGMTRREDVRTLETTREIDGVECTAILEESSTTACSRS